MLISEFVDYREQSSCWEGEGSKFSGEEYFYSIFTPSPINLSFFRSVSQGNFFSLSLFSSLFPTKWRKEKRKPSRKRRGRNIWDWIWIFFPLLFPSLSLSILWAFFEHCRPFRIPARKWVCERWGTGMDVGLTGKEPRRRKPITYAQHMFLNLSFPPSCRLHTLGVYL